MCVYVCMKRTSYSVDSILFPLVTTKQKKKKKCQPTSGFIVNFKRQRMKHDFYERDYTLNLLAYFNVNPNC